MPFRPVSTKAELDTLNASDIIEGYTSAQRGDPEPGENRGKAFWHGWRNRMIDYGILQPDAESMQLVREVLEFNQKQRESARGSKHEAR